MSEHIITVDVQPHWPCSRCDHTATDHAGWVAPAEPKCQAPGCECPAFEVTVGDAVESDLRESERE